MLIGSGGRLGQECAHSQLNNHPLGFVGRGKVLSQIMWPGMEARIRKNNGQLEAPSTQAVDSDGTYQDREGIVRKAALNRLRFGALLEGAQTNAQPQSADFDNAAWTKLNCSITPNDLTSPDGAVLADKLVEASDTNQAHAVYDVRQFTNGVTYCGSVWARAAGRDFLQIRFPNGRFAGANPPRANFNLSTGAVASSEGILNSVGIEAYPDGWYRCWIVDTCNSTASTDYWTIFAIDTDNLGASYNGDGSSGIHIWGAQLESAAFPSSYIPTTSVVTRAADDLRYDNTGEALTVESEGTIIAEVKSDQAAVDATGNLTILDMRRGSVSNARGIFVSIDQTNDAFRVHRNRSGTSSNLYGATAAVAWRSYNLAFTWAIGGGTELFVDGVSEGTAANAGAASAHGTTLDIGKTGLTTNYWFGGISKFTSLESVLSLRQVENANAVIRRVA